MILRKKIFRICFIGIDGSGKTSCSLFIKEKLIERGHSCEYIHYNHPLISILKNIFCLKRTKSDNKKQNNGGNLRSFSIPLAALIFLDSAIAYALEFKKSVFNNVLIYDRYHYVHVANYLKNGPSWITKLYIRVFPKPDVVFLLDLPAELAYNRKSEGSIQFLKKLRISYLNLKDQREIRNLKKIDAAGELEQVFNSIMPYINDLFEPGDKNVQKPT